MIWTIRQRSDLGALCAIRQGQGPKIVLLHGVGLRAEAWGAQIGPLSETFEVIAPDMAGQGESAPLSGEISLGRYSDLVAEVIEESALVVGHSMGAMIALDLAARYPQKVRGVVALNAIFERSPEAAKAVRERAEGLSESAVGDPTPTLLRWFDDLQSPEALACRDWLNGADPKGYKAAYGVFANSDGPSRSALAALEMPALFMTGALEPNSTPAMSQAMASLAPKGRAVIVEGAAHMMPMTHGEEVNRAILTLAGEVMG